MPTRFVDVLAPVALDRTYSYRIPENLDLKAGDIVSVPLGARSTTAVVWADNAEPEPRLHNRLKDVDEKLDLPPLQGGVAQLCRLDRHLHAVVARHGVAHDAAHGRSRPRAGTYRRPPCRRAAAAPDAGAAARDRAARGRHAAAKSEAAAEAGVSTGVIDGLVDEGTLEVSGAAEEHAGAAARSGVCRPDFSAEQQARRRGDARVCAKEDFGVTLLDGVTGSGKTEVYFEAVAEILRKGKQALILMPEIALTGQFLDRFAVRFGVRPHEWHSELTPRTRARNWAAIASGEAHVVIGARSALMLPYADLGLIIVDEEHDQAYKQDEGAHYHARDMAVVRGHIAKIPVVLSSATPSIETEVNARKRPLPAHRAAVTFRRPAHAAYRADRPAYRGPGARPLHRAASRRSCAAAIERASRRCCSSIAAAMRR